MHTVSFLLWACTFWGGVLAWGLGEGSSSGNNIFWGQSSGLRHGANGFPSPHGDCYSENTTRPRPASSMWHRGNWGWEGNLPHRTKCSWYLWPPVLHNSLGLNWRTQMIPISKCTWISTCTEDINIFYKMFRSHFFHPSTKYKFRGNICKFSDQYHSTQFLLKILCEPIKKLQNCLFCFRFFWMHGMWDTSAPWPGIKPAPLRGRRVFFCF